MKQHEPAAQESLSETGSASAEDPLTIFRNRILPILRSDRPSSCTECHLSGVDLGDYLHPDQAKTFVFCLIWNWSERRSELEDTQIRRTFREKAA